MKRFKRIYVEITNVCNLKCSFCSQTKRSAAFMTAETFRNILEQITPFTDYIYFHVKGEPLLHPEIGGFLDLCAEKGLKVNLTTNSTLIHEAADQILMKPALRQINFSLHSFDGNDLKESKDEYLNSIFSFIHQSSVNADTIMNLRLWNLDQRDVITNHAKRNREILTKIEQVFKLPYKIDEVIDSTKGLKIAERVYLSQDVRFDWPALDHGEDSNRGFCYGLKSQIAILVDGTVIPCCLDGEGIINLGNIHAVPFSEIIAGERAVKIRRGFSKEEAVEELCRKCSYKKRFHSTPDSSAL